MHHHDKFESNQFLNFESNQFLNFEMHANAKFWHAVSKTAVFPLVSINLIQKKSQGVQLELLQHYIKVHPDQMKSAGENEASRFSFALILWSPGKVKANETGIKW